MLGALLGHLELTVARFDLALELADVLAHALGAALESIGRGGGLLGALLELFALLFHAPGALAPLVEQPLQVLLGLPQLLELEVLLLELRL